MKERKATISTSKKGMNRSASPEQLKKGEYIFAKNINIETIEGDMLNIVTEPSNVLAAKIKKGYKIFFYKRDRITERTYLFLKNEETGHSEIGYIKNEEYTEEDDILEDECNDCNYNQIDRQPLENTTQNPYLSYYTLINDECVTDIEDGFNFSLQHPIKSCEIKNEKGAVVMYFSDGYNKDKYIDISNIDKYYVNVVPCDDNTTQDCPDFYLMNIDRDYNLILKDGVQVDLSGNLLQGEYEFFAYYSTKNGQIMSNPFRLTNKISIFDNTEIIKEQKDYATPSGKSIKIGIKNIDNRFEAYKVLVVQTTSVQSVNQRVFEIGVFPINKDSILLTDTSNLKESALSEIYQRKLDVESSSMLEASNDILYRYKLNPKKEINLQPVVNLMGSLLEWQTSVSKEGLYKKGESKESYLGYNRNEVVPLSIVFTGDSGYETSAFPFISRPHINNEKDILTVADKNAESFSKIKDDPIERWEVYNTATLEGEACNTEDLETKIVVQPLTRYCKVENVLQSTDGELKIPITEDYTNFLDFVSELTEDGCENLDVITGDLCGTLFPSAFPTQTCSADPFNGLDIVENTTPTIEEELEIGNIENLQENFIPFDFPNDYPNLFLPEYCSIYEVNLEGNKKQLFPNDDTCNTTNGYENRYTGIVRQQQPYETSPNQSVNLQPLENINPNMPSYSITYYFSYSDTDSLTDIQASPETFTDVFGDSFTYDDKVSKNAKWFNIQPEPEGTIFSVSEDKIDDFADFMSCETYRISIYKTSPVSGSTPIATFLKKSYESANILIKKESSDSISIQKDNETPLIIANSNINSLYYISIDTPVRAESFFNPCDRIFTHEQSKVEYPDGTRGNPRFSALASSGCFSVAAQKIKNKEVEITYDSITYDKTIKKTALVEFTEPIIEKDKVYNYKKGKTAYWESAIEYPDNKDLYDSSLLDINPTDLSNLPTYLKNSFELYYLDANYDWKQDIEGKDVVDFRCRKIRHPKLPDNDIAPYIDNISEKSPFSDTIIYPLGFNLESEVVRTFLDIAVSNQLITNRDRKNIKGYKILRGDLTANRRVVASGLLYNSRKYEYNNKDIIYNNYPFNALDEDKLNNISNEIDVLNNKDFFFNSPESDYYSNLQADFMLLEGYSYGQSKGQFDEVEDHPKWTILSNKAKRLASKLAFAEVASEVAIKAAQALSNQWQVAGASNGFSLGGVAAAIILALETLVAAAFKYGRYRYEWLNTFKNLGPVENFAYYYYAEGFYNNFKINNSQDDKLRTLDILEKVKNGNTSVTNVYTGEKFNINNKRREESYFLSLGENTLKYNSFQQNYEKGFNTSLTYAGENSLFFKGRSEELLKNISSPYTHFVRNLPAQHGQINSINWVDTAYYNSIDENNCDTIFGGDTFISRHTFKKKMPLFLRDANELADLQPFDYKFYTNIEEDDTDPRFYVSYDLDAEDSVNLGGSIFPEIPTNFNLDEHNRNGNYVRPPSKFYLYYYGIPNFLTETRINTNHRVARDNDRERFYPEIGDLNFWTQEKNVSIKNKEYFFYNNVYSLPNIEATNKTLPNYFDNEKNKKRQNLDNFLIYSNIDKDEESYEDPWLIYRPLDYKQLPSKFGELNKITSLEDEVLLAIFDDTNILYNRVDSTVDEGSKPSPFLGGGDVFKRRSVNFKNTEIGAGGSQNHNSILFDYGHVHIDAKRGQIIFTGRGGEKSEDISKSFDGKDLGMRHWFKKHLPFKIKKFFDVDTDNVSQGFGLSLGWDSRNERLFLTKKDFIPLDNDIVYEDNKFKLNDSEVSISDTNLFEDVSFTIAFSFKTMSWISYYDFKPDFYISQNNYFQTIDNGSIWSHLVTNKSSRVFNGKDYKSIVEYPIKGSVSAKRLLNLKIKTEFKYYLTYNDFSLRDDKTFSNITVFNRRECSGKLNLDVIKSHSFSHKYPITNNDNTQNIIATSDDDMFNINYIFNRVNKINNNQPIFLWDENQIEKSINNSKVNFKPKPVLEYMRGNWFTVRAEEDGDTNGFITFFYNLTEEENYL